MVKLTIMINTHKDKKMTQAEIIAAAVAAAVTATQESNPTAPQVEVRETSAENLQTSAKSGL